MPSASRPADDLDLLGGEVEVVVDDHAVGDRAGGHQGAGADPRRRRAVGLVDQAAQGDPGAHGEVLDHGVQGGLVAHVEVGVDLVGACGVQLLDEVGVGAYDDLGVAQRAGQIGLVVAADDRHCARTRQDRELTGQRADAADGRRDDHGVAGDRCQVPLVSGVRGQAGHAEDAERGGCGRALGQVEEGGRGRVNHGVLAPAGVGQHAGTDGDRVAG